MPQRFCSDSKNRKQEKKRIKQQRKRRKRINSRIERAVSFLAILVCVVFSVLEVVEEKKGN
ncbi:MAG: hypothetical protein K2N15_04895 [Lachnospiraceae bacterium]|nr:hypothetical protein [Lachnospiraceae bacterium]